jgi:hypothetical protein
MILLPIESEVPSEYRYCSSIQLGQGRTFTYIHFIEENSGFGHHNAVSPLSSKRTIRISRIPVLRPLFKLTKAIRYGSIPSFVTVCFLNAVTKEAIWYIAHIYIDCVFLFIEKQGEELRVWSP